MISTGGKRVISAQRSNAKKCSHNKARIFGSRAARVFRVVKKEYIQ